MQAGFAGSGVSWTRVQLPASRFPSFCMRLDTDRSSDERKATIRDKFARTNILGIPRESQHCNWINEWRNKVFNYCLLLAFGNWIGAPCRDACQARSTNCSGKMCARRRWEAVRYLNELFLIRWFAFSSHCPRIQWMGDFNNNSGGRVFTFSFINDLVSSCGFCLRIKVVTGFS